ncbi:MAG: inosine-5-monophosphate dehydrogenase [Betaproteobacteria bacterium RIFCSPLOWO2_02_FULL_67_26]|nr:MAG: inosine-5-monophosphate dehydrogenase [Betaproteobacteria bacterium RIFCSPLOWO2_02_FULL_67_26]
MAHRSIRSIIEQQAVITAPESMTVTAAACLMKDKQVGAILIMDEGRLVGIFTERDALFRVVAEGRDARTARLSEVMTRNPRTIHPDKPFPDALHLMHEGGFRHVPVVEDGRPVGMISARDALGPELEDFIYELLRQEQAQDVLSG